MIKSLFLKLIVHYENNCKYHYEMIFLINDFLDKIYSKAATYTSPTAYATYYRCAEEAYKLAVSERRLVYAWRQHMLDREHECIEYMLRCVIEAPGTL